MKISELIKRLQDIQRNHGDCECGCLCETDDIFDDVEFDDVDASTPTPP